MEEWIFAEGVISTLCNFETSSASFQGERQWVLCSRWIPQWGGSESHHTLLCRVWLHTSHRRWHRYVPVICIYLSGFNIPEKQLCLQTCVCFLHWFSSCILLSCLYSYITYYILSFNVKHIEFICNKMCYLNENAMARWPTNSTWNQSQGTFYYRTTFTLILTMLLRLEGILFVVFNIYINVLILLLQ